MQDISILLLFATSLLMVSILLITLIILFMTRNLFPYKYTLKSEQIVGKKSAFWKREISINAKDIKNIEITIIKGWPHSAIITTIKDESIELAITWTEQMNDLISFAATHKINCSINDTC